MITEFNTESAPAGHRKGSWEVRPNDEGESFAIRCECGWTRNVVYRVAEDLPTTDDRNTKAWTVLLHDLEMHQKIVAAPDFSRYVKFDGEMGNMSKNALRRAQAALAGEPFQTDRHGIVWTVDEVLASMQTDPGYGRQGITRGEVIEHIRAANRGKGLNADGTGAATSPGGLSYSPGGADTNPLTDRIKRGMEKLRHVFSPAGVEMNVPIPSFVDPDEIPESPPLPKMQERMEPTSVTFMDSRPELLAHKADRILINGQEVMVEDGSIELEFGFHEVTRVTVTLLPAHVHFIHPEESTNE